MPPRIAAADLVQNSDTAFVVRGLRLLQQDRLALGYFRKLATTRP